VNAWLRQWRQMRRLRRDESRARDRFFRAHYAYLDTAVVLGDAPGAWGPLGAVSQAQEEATARMREFTQAQAGRRRAEQLVHFA
jgi:hypothetical protein